MKDKVFLLHTHFGWDLWINERYKDTYQSRKAALNAAESLGYDVKHLKDSDISPFDFDWNTINL